MSNEQLSLFEVGGYRAPGFRTKEESRGDQIERAARAFVEKEPEVWRLFCRYTFRLIKANREHYGAKSVFERIRWHTAVRGEDDFKLNNNYTAVFARWFHRAYPEHDGFFRTRERASESEDPRQRRVVR